MKRNSKKRRKKEAEEYARRTSPEALRQAALRIAADERRIQQKCEKTHVCYHVGLANRNELNDSDNEKSKSSSLNRASCVKFSKGFPRFLLELDRKYVAPIKSMVVQDGENKVCSFCRKILTEGDVDAVSKFVAADNEVIAIREKDETSLIAGKNSGAELLRIKSRYEEQNKRLLELQAAIPTRKWHYISDTEVEMLDTETPVTFEYTGVAIDTYLEENMTDMTSVKREIRLKTVSF